MVVFTKVKGKKGKRGMPLGVLNRGRSRGGFGS
jgi:hypothetical protein